MVPFAVLISILIFITADFLIRTGLERRHEALLRKEREAALDKGLRLDFSAEAKTLRRVDIENPKARILAVDDEEVVLGSFRKLLVLAGYAIDTVQSGPEALTLLARNNYDFLFVDLKMPDMDGVDVCKAAKHLRPDVDVVIITGFASVESAVETMKFGALDYFQKPFTEEEIVAFINKCLHRRQDRLAREKKPVLHLVTATGQTSASPRDFDVPGSLFIAPAHTWLGITPGGTARIGLDDFALKIIGPVESIELPAAGSAVRLGDTLFHITRNGIRMAVPAPVSGRVAQVNEALRDKPEIMNTKPYDTGWACDLDTPDLARELSRLRLGAQALPWYEDEINRFITSVDKIGRDPSGTGLTADGCQAFAKAFLSPAKGA